MIPTKEQVLKWANESKRPRIQELLKQFREAMNDEEAHQALTNLFLRYMVRENEER